MARATLRQKIRDVVCGDALAIERTISGVPAGLTITKAWLTIKATITDLDADALLQLTVTSVLASTGQITDTGATGVAVVRFTLSGAQTLLVPPEASYPFDVQVQTSDGALYTACKGTIRLEQQVTIATT